MNSNSIRRNNNVYVFGAGASQEAGLATGDGLKNDISGLFNYELDFGGLKSGDPLIYYALRKYIEQNKERSDKLDHYLKEALHIRKALPLAISIDNFIDSHKGNKELALCGKLAIVRSILQAEKKSLLYFERDLNDTIETKKLINTWYPEFFKIITENCTVDDLINRFQSIALIIFNYDRCIEHFLYYGLIIYYGVSEQEASQIICHLNIYHPYGKVGNLPWEKKGKSTNFGMEPNVTTLLDLSSEIQTFTEGTDPDSSEIAFIREKIENSNKLIFMGFAFHKLNMDLLRPIKLSRTDFGTLDIYATILGVSPSDKSVIQAQIDSLLNRSTIANMADATCNKFFSEYWRSLSFD